MSANLLSVNFFGSSDRSNPQYNLGVTPNKWENDDEYYWVQNPDADEETFGSPQYNKHIPPAAIVAIEVAAEVDGKMSVVTINRGVNCGEFSVAFIKDELFEIVIQAAPTPPTNAELEDTGNDSILPDGAVTIDCTNEQANHTDKTYSLIAGTYTVSDSATWVSDGSGSGYYIAEVTIDADQVSQYVTQYDADTVPTHDLVANQGDQTITLIWQNGQWVTADGSAPVTYNVVCTTESGGDENKPNVPTDDELKAALSGMIQVDCITNEEQHLVKSYGVIDGGINRPNPDEVTKNGETYTYTVTVDSAKYLGEYISEYGNHELVSTGIITITLQYDAEKETWYVDTPVTIEVKCDSGTTDPEDPEKPTLSEDDVVTMLGTNAIAVKCIDDKHITQYHPLEDTIVSLGNVIGSKETGYQCDVTVTLDIGNLSSYLADYNEFTTPQKHSLMSTDTITRTITLKCEPNDEVDWYFPGECPIITIDVTCASGETTIPAPEDETVNNLLGKAVIIDCTNDEANHENEAFSLIEDTYQIGEVYMADGIPHCDVTITAPDKYAAQYSYNTNTNHPLSPADQGSQAITLKYVKGEWAIDDDGIVRYTVACKDTSTEPTPTPTPDPTPTPTPTPDPGDDNNPPYNPPYIPPVDPDDSGVSDLLNTDDHIQYLFGYPEGTFGPENNMTRAEVAQMFYNLLLDQDVTITKTFDDVPANAWYAKAVNTLASLGVVSGVGNGDFEPERSITRAEFTSIAMKFAEGKTGGTNIFSDVKSTDWFYRAVVNSTQYGWIHGYGDGTFRPNNPITRVEVTAIVNNMLGREADVDFVTEHYDELNHFSDLEVSHWGYYHIVEATNDHDYTKPSSGENWTELN